MKKRHLKKWVKVIIKSLLIILIIPLLIIYTTNKRKKNIEKTNIIIEKKENKITDQETNTIVEENLERYTYKGGFYYENLSNELKKYITGKSYPEEPNEKYEKISYGDLKYLKLKYFDYDGKEHNNGEMIVNKEIAKEVLEIFYELYQNKYPIDKIKLVEEYNAEDELSMQDNNTSSFNYRLVEDSEKLSWHSFGLAIDLNPLYNPYVIGNKVYPSNASEYKDRSKNFKGKIDENDLAFKIFTKYNWKWGGNFYGEKDYQHFYKEIYDESIRESRN